MASNTTRSGGNAGEKPVQRELTHLRVGPGCGIRAPRVMVLRQGGEVVLLAAGQVDEEQDPPEGRGDLGRLSVAVDPGPGEGVFHGETVANDRDGASDGGVQAQRRRARGMAQRLSAAAGRGVQGNCSGRDARAGPRGERRARGFHGRHRVRSRSRRNRVVPFQPIRSGLDEQLAPSTPEGELSQVAVPSRRGVFKLVRGTGKSEALVHEVARGERAAGAKLERQLDSCRRRLGCSYSREGHHERGRAALRQMSFDSVPFDSHGLTRSLGVPRSGHSPWPRPDTACHERTRGHLWGAAGESNGGGGGGRTATGC